ncbi:DUF6588 family protein [Lacinutrix sp. 5H-3-7-4]|uniref:DUF6588 family protein n=1 Tax=Lacinutrix sp. (strain 5H-3-7-4) TaxID=983544 RepID=UPI00020A358E|nr:DUF6588 family protein [Lacinutrix sp. 5H-3-7-4]AEH00212.1 hypothetical protein Lacal_0360 [Lacinutrix sp. 5H-3-7-4]
MKKIGVILIALISTLSSNAQENIDDLLAAGIDDAKRFSTNYVKPANDGVAYGINNGWFNNAKTPKRFGFELSIIGNATFINDEDKQFVLNVRDYENIRFPDNSPSKGVATALGHNDPPQTVIITYDDPIFGNQEQEFELPTGIGSENINLIPTVFLQASFSPFKGTQIKGRFFPKVDVDDVKVGLYGVGLQQDFTTLLPADHLLPITISGLVAYTHLDGSYDFTSSSNVAGENQRVETETNTLLFQAIVGTRFKILNFFGAVGYISGENETSLLGTYTVSDGVFFSEDIVDPFTIESDTKGVTATLGANLKLGFFGLNAAYTIADFSSASLGMNFSF